LLEIFGPRHEPAVRASGVALAIPRASIPRWFELPARGCLYCSPRRLWRRRSRAVICACCSWRTALALKRRRSKGWGRRRTANTAETTRTVCRRSSIGVHCRRIRQRVSRFRPSTRLERRPASERSQHLIW